MEVARRPSLGILVPMHGYHNHHYNNAQSRFEIYSLLKTIIRGYSFVLLLPLPFRTSVGHRHHICFTRLLGGDSSNFVEGRFGSLPYCPFWVASPWSESLLYSGDMDMPDNNVLYDGPQHLPQYVAPKDIFHDYNSVIGELEFLSDSHSLFDTIVCPRVRSPAHISLRPNVLRHTPRPLPAPPAHPLMMSFIAPQYALPPHSRTLPPSILTAPRLPHPRVTTSHPKRKRPSEDEDPFDDDASDMMDPKNEDDEDAKYGEDDDEIERIENLPHAVAQAHSRSRGPRSRGVKAKTARRGKAEATAGSIALLSSRDTFQWLRAALSKHPIPSLQHSPCLFCHTNQHSMGRHVRSIHRFQISEKICLALKDNMDVSLSKIDELLILSLLVFDLENPTVEECAEIVELQATYSRWPSDASSIELDDFNTHTYRSLWNRVITEFAEKWYMENTCSCGKRYTRRESAERHARRAGAGHRVLGDDASDASSSPA